MKTYVLVGGAWIGAWAWAEVTRRLRSRGHDVHPVTLTGLGEREHLGGPDVNLDVHITDVVKVIDYEDLHDVVLVGHSYAGIVVEGVGDRRSDRITTVVYVDTAPLGDGAASVDFYPPDARTALEAVVREQGDGWRLPFPGIEQLGQQASLAGLDDAALRLLSTRATSHPFGTYTQPLRLTGSEVSYRRRAIVCSDGGFTVAQIRAALASDDPGMFVVYAGPGWEFDELHTGHWPMLSMPEELAEVPARYGHMAAGLAERA
ncbi:MAG: alpha/beta hydrolase [Actinobacteria bacterium]|nr:alpha/beta hydrolase [Actinomycetota bacterium]